MDGLQGKILLKWMIWGYHYFRKHPFGFLLAGIMLKLIHQFPPFSERSKYTVYLSKKNGPIAWNYHLRCQSPPGLFPFLGSGIPTKRGQTKPIASDQPALKFARVQHLRPMFILTASEPRPYHIYVCMYIYI